MTKDRNYPCGLRLSHAALRAAVIVTILPIFAFRIWPYIPLPVRSYGYWLYAAVGIIPAWVLTEHLYVRHHLNKRPAQRAAGRIQRNVKLDLKYALTYVTFVAALPVIILLMSGP